MIVQTGPETYSAEIDGVFWQNITPVSRFWQDVQDMIAGGAGVTQPPVPSDVPQAVSRFQAKAALAQAGLLAQADAVVAASGNVVLQLAWAEAGEFQRSSPGINMLAPLIGLDSEGLDDLFRTAAGIVA